MPRDVTFARFTAEIPVQFLKAPFPMFFTVVGKSTEERTVHPLNVSSGMVANEGSRVTLASLMFLKKMFGPAKVFTLSKFMDARLSHSLNAPSPSEFTASGKITDVRFLQLENDSLPMEVAVFGMVIEVRPRHQLNRPTGMPVIAGLRLTLLSLASPPNT